MLKIAVLSSGLGHIPRGIEVWSENLANLLDRNGVNVTLFKGGGKKQKKFEKIIPCIRMNSRWLIVCKISWGLRYAIQQYSFFILIIPFLHNYNVVQTSDYLIGRLIHKTKKYGLINCELLFTDGNIFSLNLLRGFKYVHETSDYYVAQANELGIDTSNWFVVPHFVDTSIFKPANMNLRKSLSISDDAFVILSVGAVGDAIKRMTWLIDEVNLFQSSEPDKEIHLIIVGSKESNANEIIEYGKHKIENIHFLFNVPHNEMTDVYNTANVFVLCTLIERFGLVFIEAMACGVPSIGHIFPVTKYIIGNGGDCIDMTKQEELSNTLKKYLDIDYWNHKNKNAIKIVQENFSDDAVFDRFEKAYKMISNK